MEMDEGIELPWVIELRFPSVPSVAKLRIMDRAVIGRADKANAVYPDLDLTPWGAAELDIAPEHVAIFPQEDHLYLEDLGSGRPTLLNGVRLEPNTPHRLEHGDDLHLGALHLQVRVIASPTYGSVVRAQPGLSIPEEGVPAHGRTVLIVEDDPEASEIFRLILERAGFTTRICREVVSAIRVLNTEAPSAILLDLMLPDVHGLELCRYVRRDIEQREIPVVVVSAVVTQASIAQAMEAGADVFLGKPVSMHELVKVISALIRWYESKKPSLQTKRLDDSAALQAIPTQVRRDAVVFFVAGHQEPIAVVVPRRITLGRRSGSGGGVSSRHHIDLDRYGAFDAGVSRVHAAVHREEDGFYIEDLGSSNGTWVDGERVYPHQRHVLQNASEIRLGGLRLRAFFFTENDEDVLTAPPE